MSELPPPDETLLRRLHALACTPFTLAAFRERWREFGWSPDPPADSNPYGFRVSLPEGWALIVDPLGPEVIGVMLAFHYWEDRDDAQRKAAFHTAFDRAGALALRLFPEPFLRWTDADEQAHRALAWEGTHGILILQEASFDPQFGLEVDFWLAGCARAEFRPETPLIDWLTRRSGRLHDERGFPSLPE